MKTFLRSKTEKALFLLLIGILFVPSVAAWQHSRIFGYPGTVQQGMELFPQWLTVLKRHPVEDVPETTCSEAQKSPCFLTKWIHFLDGIKYLPAREQLKAVNIFGNKTDYVVDMDNYQLEDYWAIVKEFMYNGGDCEDYAITKLMSLRYLGFSVESTRITIVMDTNLGVAHAVLAVEQNGKILILDNQAEEILPDTSIVHYTPVFSINEKNWWIHMPPS